MKRTIFAGIAVLGIAAPLAAQWLNEPTKGIPRTADGKPTLSPPAPRTPYGKPDLSGLWNRLSPKYARNIAADLKPGEVLPWADALLQQNMEDLGRGFMNVPCMPFGPHYVVSADTTGAEQMKIVQTPSLIVILNPDLTHRQIFMDGRALEAAPNPSWMGYSVGRWDGDTLVVESNGYNDRTWLLGGYPHTEALRMTERYKRTDFGHMEVSVTFQDPKAYNKAWTLPLHAQFAADTELIEAVCNDFDENRQEHWVGKVSDAEKTAVKVAPEIVAKYVGVYRGMYL